MTVWSRRSRIGNKARGSKNSGENDEADKHQDFFSLMSECENNSDTFEISGLEKQKKIFLGCQSFRSLLLPNKC